MMLNNLQQLGPMAWMAAPVAAAIALWSQIQGFIQRFTSMLVVTTDVHESAAYSLMNYCWKNFKTNPLGQHRYTGSEFFVRPQDRYEQVVIELPGKSITFLKGWRPLFISTSGGGGGGNNSPVSSSSEGSGLTVTYLRGTFKLEELLIQAVDYTNNINKTNSERKRFFARKVFGKRRENNAPYGEEAKALQGGGFRNGFRPLKWKLEDLGSPSSDHPFSHLAYPEEIQGVITYLQRWKESQKWYRDKGLDWRFGFGMYGPPGTGKTSFARAVAQLLDMPIYIFDLTTMDNQDVVENWKYALNSSPAMVLFEDFDRIFDEDKNLKQNPQTGYGGGLSLDCILNCISGVEPSNGILTVITANDITKFDTALGIPADGEKSTRPGRLDKMVYFGTLAAKERKALADRILADFSEVERKTVVKNGADETGAQFSKRCEMLAIARYWNSREVVQNKN